MAEMEYRIADHTTCYLLPRRSNGAMIATAN